MNDIQLDLPNIMHIEMCGAIASGKTSLANLLSQIGMNAVLENFGANPFFELFYSDPVKYAFETEITFSLQHYNQIKVSSEREAPFVCDFSPILDLAYADVTLRGSGKEVFLTVHKEVRRQLPTPALLIHVRCSASVLLERIRARKRACEESITLEYLELLNNALAHRVDEVKSKIKVISIGSEELNFVTDGFGKERVISLVREALA